LCRFGLANGRGRVSPRTKGKLFQKVVSNQQEDTAVNYADARWAHLRFSTISCIACGAEHGDREVVKRHGDHFGVLLRTTE
jgi:hypothetical protein